MTFTGKKDEIEKQLLKLDNDTLYDVKIERYKEKRGLKANNYAWKLMGEIAGRMTLSKEEVYLQMLSDYGKFKTDESGQLIEGYFPYNFDLICMGSYWKFIELVSISGQVKRKCFLLKGSSEYDSHEMYEFIQGIEYEAKKLGIETLEERNLRLLLEEKENNYE